MPRPLCCVACQPQQAAWAACQRQYHSAAASCWDRFTLLQQPHRPLPVLPPTPLSAAGWVPDSDIVGGVPRYDIAAVKLETPIVGANVAALVRPDANLEGESNLELQVAGFGETETAFISKVGGRCAAWLLSRAILVSCSPRACCCAALIQLACCMAHCAPFWHARVTQPLARFLAAADDAHDSQVSQASGLPAPGRHRCHLRRLAMGWRVTCLLTPCLQPWCALLNTATS